ncbi:MAG: ribose 5-phosphate isomerase A [Gammaproteobacteria bacterium AqS3]|nr:ribose 5-phosphate isomerase A [Gammaproteobacteria bacterium AqS3]
MTHRLGKKFAVTQAALKKQVAESVAQAIWDRLEAGMPPILGVGTGSTVNCLFEHQELWRRIDAAMPTSQTTEVHLKQLGIALLRPDQHGEMLPLYVDGADEFAPDFALIKGGGGALTQEKRVAARCREFWCLVDASKRVGQLGGFALPVEVTDAELDAVSQRFLQDLGAERVAARPHPSENGHRIIDVQGLAIEHPDALEVEIESWDGVICCGLFARNRPQRVFCSGPDGIEILEGPER